MTSKRSRSEQRSDTLNWLKSPTIISCALMIISKYAHDFIRKKSWYNKKYPTVFSMKMADCK